MSVHRIGDSEGDLGPFVVHGVAIVARDGAEPTVAFGHQHHLRVEVDGHDLPRLLQTQVRNAQKAVIQTPLGKLAKQRQDPLRIVFTHGPKMHRKAVAQDDIALEIGGIHGDRHCADTRSMDGASAKQA